MKKFFYLLIVCCSFAACKKSDNRGAGTNPPTQGVSVFGKWEWYKTTAFYATNVTPHTTGKWWQISFYTDSTYYQTGNYMSPAIMPDSIGHFNLVVRTLYFPLRQEILLRLSSPNMIAPWHLSHRFISNDTLILDSGSAYDGPVYYMVRR